MDDVILCDLIDTITRRLFLYCLRLTTQKIALNLNRLMWIKSKIMKQKYLKISMILTVFGSVDEISHIISAADLSAAALSLFPWESLFVGDFLFLESLIYYKSTKYYTLCECKLCVVLVRSA